MALVHHGTNAAHAVCAASNTSFYELMVTASKGTRSDNDVAAVVVVPSIGGKVPPVGTIQCAPFPA